MTKKQYTRPEMDTVKLSTEDILNVSDVLIDGSSLFETAQGG